MRLEVRDEFKTDKGKVAIFSLKRFESQSGVNVSELPYSLKVLLENLLRHLDGKIVTDQALSALAGWRPEAAGGEIPYLPSRVILQDFTGIPVILDLAAMRSAFEAFGGDPARINPVIPTDLVIDHSVQVDFFGAEDALRRNVEMEFKRNSERYAFLKWAQQAFDNLRVIPPGKGIIHQVNLEYLASVVHLREADGSLVAFPDTLLGTDSHTTMVNGLGVLGWGVGGIEAEAVMLGQPYYLSVPEVVGVRLSGELPEGTTATDLVLTVTNLLRKHGVVGRFVEFFGPGLSGLSVPDRTTIANMAPEYGATVGFFPVDDATLEYLRGTGRSEEHVRLVAEYTKAQGLFYNPAREPRYTEVLEVDMGSIEPVIAGPRNPEDRVPLRRAKETFLENLNEFFKSRAGEGTSTRSGESLRLGVEPLKSFAKVRLDGEECEIGHGSVVIAAITSCTNTSNPSVMVGAGLLAKKAVEAGVKPKPYVKTSLAPGSMVVTEYLREAGLLRYLEALRFNLVGYGCTTCIGNSGPLPEAVETAVKANGLYVAAVLSGNRNFEARIHPLVRANFLGSPMLVVAYALAGRMDLDLTSEPLAYSDSGRPVYLKDVWPSLREIRETVEKAIKPEVYRRKYAEVLRGDEDWERLHAPSGSTYAWDPNSTYIREPPFFRGMPREPTPPGDIRGAHVLALLGHRVTTDHISPAGAIQPDSPAGRFLQACGVSPAEFNTYGSRRGNHEVMVRGAFANVRLKNRMVPGVEGGWTVHVPSGERMTIFEAAARYRAEGTPLLVIGGKQYGAGSSRDWAAKGTSLLGVRAVIAESFERIHRSNLVGVGVLPLQFREGENADALGLTGFERFDVWGISEGLAPGKELTVRAQKPEGGAVEFKVRARLDTPIEVEYFVHGGILPYVLRSMLAA